MQPIVVLLERSLMDYYANFIVKQKKTIVIVFILLALAGAVLFTGVKVNYKLSDYLPPSAQSTKAVQIMGEEFTQAVPNASVMARDVSLVQASSYKEQLKGLEGVEEVLWLDDMVDIMKPLEIYDADTVEGFYKNGNALYTVTITEGLEAEAIDGIRELLGDKGAVSGEAADTNAMRGSTSSEVTSIMLIMVPAILLILVLSTSSWIEPLLFIAAIVVSIIINMGINLFFGDISFVTNSVGPILQLAVSLDYAIFLLHSFADNLKESRDAETAMKSAMKKSVKTVAASALTTLFGFIALTFMDFGIGADLGLNLVRGITLSFMSCMIFLPALTLLSYKAITKTRHREFLPGFSNINKFFSKLVIPIVILALLLTVPAFLGQQNVLFTYGNSNTDTGDRNSQDVKAINEEFGQSNMMALLVPKESIVKEYELGQELEKVAHVTGVMSFASQVGTGIPADFLDEEVTQQFYSENYSRIILYLDTPNEGELAFGTVESVNQIVQKYYGDDFYSAGQSANLYDMKTVVASDNFKVNLIAVISIFAVLLFAFKSAILPFILLFTIEIGIWINLSIPYFMGMPLNFLGYLVISTVQLGATVDYAILLTSYYMDNRKLMGQKSAISKSMGETFKSILISGATLTIAGVALNFSSSNPIVSELGLLLSRGTILSMLMVVCLLPGLLKIFDKLIGVTTYKAEFFKSKDAQNK
jgi:predicted RND superfamily exporter protein